MTRLTVRAHIDWVAEQPATAVLLVRVAHVAGQAVGEEDLQVDNADVEDPGPRPRGGARPLRLHARPGPVRLRYMASVEVDDAPLDTELTLPTLGDLDLDPLPWTLPSRYCPSDVLAATAEHLFADTPRTRALLDRSAAGSRPTSPTGPARATCTPPRTRRCCDEPACAAIWRI